MKPKLYISFTSIPTRINNIDKLLHSISSRLYNLIKLSYIILVIAFVCRNSMIFPYYKIKLNEVYSEIKLWSITQRTMVLLQRYILLPL